MDAIDNGLGPLGSGSTELFQDDFERQERTTTGSFGGHFFKLSLAPASQIRFTRRAIAEISAREKAADRT